MFYIFCTQLRDLGFSSIIRNYFEAGHGKGDPDGVGGALKRSADAVAARGTDVPDAATFYELLADKTFIKLYFVPESHVQEAVQALNYRQHRRSLILSLARWHDGEFNHRSVSCIRLPSLNHS